MTPVTMKAVVTNGNGGIDLAEIDVPKPGPIEVLIKVYAAAQNPSDWKLVERNPSLKGAVVGTDFAGVIEQLGPDVPELRKVGDRVCGFVLSATSANGSFAEYVVADAKILISLPSGWEFEQAAQMPLVIYTAWQCLYQSQNLPSPLQPTLTPFDILVWGGSTSLGQYTIQLAKASGLRVIATASPHNFDLLKTLGADLVFSYKEPDTPQKIKDVTTNNLKCAVDCISEGNSAEKVALAIGDGGGIVSASLPYESKREDVSVVFQLVYELLGKPVAPFGLPENPDQYKFGAEISVNISEVVAKGLVKPGPIKLIDNGLEGVKEGFQYMTDGKVSGEKITYRIVDTPKHLV